MNIRQSSTWKLKEEQKKSKLKVYNEFYQSWGSFRFNSRGKYQLTARLHLNDAGLFTSFAVVKQPSSPPPTRMVGK